MRIWEELRPYKLQYLVDEASAFLQMAIDDSKKAEDGNFVNPQDIIIGRLISAITTLEYKVADLEQQLSQIGRNP